MSKLKQGLPHLMDISYVNYHVRVSTKLLSSLCVPAKRGY